MTQDGDGIHCAGHCQARETPRAGSVDDFVSARPSPPFTVVVPPSVGLPGGEFLCGHVAQLLRVEDVVLGADELKPGDGKEVGEERVVGVTWVEVVGVEAKVAEDGEVGLRVGVDESHVVGESVVLV